MFYGKPRQPKLEDLNEAEVMSEKRIADYEERHFDEKQDSTTKKSCNASRIAKFAVIFMLSIVLMVRRTGFFSSSQALAPGRVATSLYSETTASNEGIQVSYPYIPKASYGKPVYSSVLVDHVFGFSWGAPSVNSFAPPKNVTFNRVVLTLNTSVDYVQYDRLAHLYVGGAEIWRTSTIEPGGSLKISSFKKDVSSYLTLFQQKSEVLFQLDNIVNEGLKGEFHIVLTADFYYEDELKAQEDVENHKDYKHFSIRHPANKVYPLVQGSFPPVKYLPDDKFNVKLPQVSKNTTRLRLAIFTSGNGNEEFWYTNVVDKFVDLFKGKIFGHGPQRFVNVYFNGVKIATQVPQPVIFTGGISPSLWYPIVSIDAFDLKSIDLDLSVLLPALWESSDNVLAIEVASSVDESTTAIGQNWITSANILTYENSEVVDATGEVGVPVQVIKDDSFVINPPFTGFLTQILDGKLLTAIESSLNFTLSSGKELLSKIGLNTTGAIVHVGVYDDYGDKQSIVQLGTNKKELWFQDVTDEKPVHELSTELVYPLVLSLNETDLPGDVVFDATIVTSKFLRVKVNGTKALKTNTYQNGTSQFHLTPNGNHGTGALTSTYNLTMHEPFGEFKYRRVVDAKNGKIESDVEIVNPKHVQETEDIEYPQHIITGTGMLHEISFGSPFFSEFIGNDLWNKIGTKKSMFGCHLAPREKKFKHLVHSFHGME